MAHITGGGFYDNLPRILPNGVRVELYFPSWPKPPIFDWLQKQGGLSWPEMLQTFNCGIGMVLVCPKRQTEDILQRLKALDQEAWLIGKVTAGKQGQERVQIRF